MTRVALTLTSSNTSPGSRDFNDPNNCSKNECYEMTALKLLLPIGRHSNAKAVVVKQQRTSRISRRPYAGTVESALHHAT